MGIPSRHATPIASPAMLQPALRSLLAGAALATLALSPADAQVSPKDTTQRDTTRRVDSTARPVRPDSAKPAAAVAAKPADGGRSLDFSGVIFGNYQLRTDSAARSTAGGKRPNKFDVERVYLTFRMPVGDRASIRATTDIFQNPATGYYGGWVVRLKYAYLQYDFLKDFRGHKGFDASGRLGMLQNVVIDHEEGFWPRYLAPTVTDRSGFFQSSDVGVATQVSLPGKFGEAYATVTNGPGYQFAENDRFKDVALRVSLTPLASRGGWLKTLAITPWVYHGKVASRFANAAADPITEAMPRDRWGIFVGEKHPLLTAGFHYAHRTDAFETGATPDARVEADSGGHAWSVYAITKPVHWKAGKNTSTLGALFRFDDFTPRDDRPGDTRFIVAGLQYEPTQRTTFSVDYQRNAPHAFTGAVPTVRTETWFVHWAANF